MSQYRQSPFANLTPVVKNLLIINIIFAIADVVLRNQFDMQGNLGIYYFDSPHFRLWQIITYMFMHAPLLSQPAHLLFNMFALFMFGPILEYSLGSKKFFNLYMICGIGAIVLQMIMQAIEIQHLTGGITLPHPITDSTFRQYGSEEIVQKLKDIYGVPVVGASGAIFGVLVAFATLYPNMELLIFFIPIPIKAKYVISAYVLFEIYSSIHQSQSDDVAHLAHVGGALFGFALIKIWGTRRKDTFY